MNPSWMIPVLVLLNAAGCIDDAPLATHPRPVPLVIENARGETLSVDVTLEPADGGPARTRSHSILPGRHQVEVLQLRPGDHWLNVVVEDMEARLLVTVDAQTTGLEVQLLSTGIVLGPS